VNTEENYNLKKSQESVNLKQEKYLIFLKCCHFSTLNQMSVPDLVNSSFTTESFAVKVWRRFFFTETKNRCSVFQYIVTETEKY